MIQEIILVDKNHLRIHNATIPYFCVCVFVHCYNDLYSSTDLLVAQIWIVRLFCRCSTLMRKTPKMVTHVVWVFFVAVFLSPSSNWNIRMAIRTFASLGHFYFCILRQFVKMVFKCTHLSKILTPLFFYYFINVGLHIVALSFLYMLHNPLQYRCHSGINSGMPITIYTLYLMYLKSCSIPEFHVPHSKLF